MTNQEKRKNHGSSGLKRGSGWWGWVGVWVAVAAVSAEGGRFDVEGGAGMG